MKQILLLSLTILFLLPVYGGNTQEKPATPQPEKMDISKVAGTYREKQFTLVIKKKNKYKTSMAAPRPLVSKGTWEIHNDTLICYLRRRNTKINDEGRKIEGKPVEFRFILADGKMYNIVGNERILFSPYRKNG